MKADKKTLDTFAAFTELSNPVNNGETVVLEEWNNGTQTTGLFIKKGSRKNTLVGFNIRDEHPSTYRGVSFVPSYKQIIGFLSALDIWQFKFKKGDEEFWLEVALNALIALSKRDDEYDDMLAVIREKLKSNGLDKKREVHPPIKINVKEVKNKTKKKPVKGRRHIVP